MKCFHAHTPSHSPTPSHMPMPSVAIITGNTNDTHISSLCRLTNTQCNLPMGNQSRVNPDSYHSTLGLSDNHDRVFSLGNRNFGLCLGSLTPKHNFLDNTTGLLHPYRIFRTIPRVFYTQVPGFHLRGLMTLFLLRPTHINYFSFYDLNYESLLDVVPKKNSTHIHQKW